MNACDRIRTSLLESDRGGLPAELRAHLRDCPACARFAERADAARDFLRDHRSDFDPDPAFATRVSARLNGTAPMLMGRIALRLMPVALALVVVLGVAVARGGASSSTVVSADSETDLLEWVLDVDEGA